MMKLSVKLWDLKKSYIDKMPEKVLMEDKVALKYNNRSVEDDQEFFDLPEVQVRGDDWNSYVLKVISYEDGKMRCIDPDNPYQEDIIEYDLKTHHYLFPLELLAEINEH